MWNCGNEWMGYVVEQGSERVDKMEEVGLQSLVEELISKGNKESTEEQSCQ